MKLIIFISFVCCCTEGVSLFGKQKFKDYWRKFCGLNDCYEELGLGANATKAQIRRAYRDLSLIYHPDKNPGDSIAADKFRRVALANEVLTNDEQRKKYDYYNENPAEYFQLYGSYLEYAYAPKSSILTVFIFLLIFASLIHYALQWNHYWRVVAILKSAAIKRLPLTGGGSVLALDLRRQADDILKNEQKKANKKSTRLTKKEEKDKLETILNQLINQIPPDETPPDLVKPAFSEILFFKVITFPFTYGHIILTYIKILFKRVQNKELTEIEKQIIIERYLPGVALTWDTLSDQDQDSLLAQDCHIRANFDKWTTENIITTSDAPINTKGTLSAKDKREIRQRRKNPVSTITTE